jgi:hypothetical protein
VIPSLLDAFNNEDGCDIVTRRTALWSLGQICSTAFGFKTVFSLNDDFIAKLIKVVTSSQDFSLRGAAFYALGLVGRSTFGAQGLMKHGWEISPNKGIAVAVPTDPSVLFNYNRDADNPVHPLSRIDDIGLFRELYPFITSGRVSLEVEVMSNISKVHIDYNCIQYL